MGMAVGSAFAGSVIIKSGSMAVTVDDAFPRVIQYEWLANGAVLYGQEDPLKEVTINEANHTPKVEFELKGKDTASYNLEFPALDVEMEVQFRVEGSILHFNITEIEEDGDVTVKTIEFPRHNLVSVRSSQSGARLAACSGVSGDEFAAITDKTPPKKYRKSHVILHTDQLAASVMNNTIQNRNQVWIETVKKPGYKRMGAWNNYWRYRYLDTEIVELPWAKVIIAADVNGDQIVDWQDAAILHRDTMTPKFGADKLKKSICYINMNFASLAQNPFLRTLDNIKKFSHYIDGFDQIVELKGYGSEGHDSAHPDYGVNFNTRAGGLKDLNFMIEKAAEYNTDIGFHINHTEAYPEARYFSEELLKQPRHKAWAWMDQSYDIDRYADIISGNFDARLEEMKRNVPGLAFTYVDTYGGQEWEAWKLSSKLNSLGLYIWTEYAQNLDNAAIWTHQSWGPSRMARFIFNQERDVWNNHLLLKGGATRDAGHSGWHNQQDLQITLRDFYINVLPNRYMMNFPIGKWADERVDFLGVDLTSVDEDGIFNLYKDGRRIAQGNTMFIPWDPVKETKIYHWNDEGGITTWQLPVSWGTPANVKLYQLTDLGRVPMGDLKVTDGKVVITAKAKTPYAVYKMAVKNRPVEWSAGSPVKDMGFDSHGFEQWSKSSTHSSDDHIFAENDAFGNTILKVTGNNGADARLSQTMTGLVPGKSYAASVWVRSHGGRTVGLCVTDPGGSKVETAIADTDVLCVDECQKFRGTYFQRIKLYFVPTKDTATIELLATKGYPDSLVYFDDVRVVEAARSKQGKHLLFDDFETCDQGWGPFMYATAGSGRTHLSELHEGFTDDTLNGNWSLKIFDEGIVGEVIRTVPATLRLAPKTQYTVTFEYKSTSNEVYSVVARSRSADADVLAKVLPATKRGTFKATFTTGDHYDYYLAIEKIKGRGTLVIDDFTVDGPKPKRLPPPVEAPADGSIPGYMLRSVTATSAQGGGGAMNVVDGTPETLWHTKYDLSDKLPQSITLEFEQPYSVNRLSYLSRPTGPNGIITAYTLYASSDGEKFEKIASGKWKNDHAEKTIVFKSVKARYIRLEATEGHGGWASAGEIRVFKAK